MIDLIEKMQELESGAVKTEPAEGFWSGHSVFQIPVRVLGYKGKAESLVLTYFFERANSISFYSSAAVLIQISVQEKTIALRTGLNRSTVSEAIVSLEADDCIRVLRRRDPVTKKIKLSVYVLLHSESKNPLVATPGSFGVCHHNADRPYITAPKELREKLKGMQAAGRAVYLSALALASRKVSTSFGVTPEEWKKESLLGRNAFNRGLKQCAKLKLLTYKRYVLTLNDPATGAPTYRVAGGRIDHENPQWKFDLNKVTAEQWQATVERLLRKEFIVGSSGWTHATKTTRCPLCKHCRCFRANFGASQFLCEHCNANGRLAQLVMRVRRIKMSEAKLFIQEQMTPVEVAA
jgi:hypothetical protein